MRNKTIILTKVNFEIKRRYFLTYIISKTREVSNFRKVRVNIDDIYSYKYFENVPDKHSSGIKNGSSVKPYTWVEIVGDKHGGFYVTERQIEIEKLINNAE